MRSVPPSVLPELVVPVILLQLVIPTVAICQQLREYI